MVNRNTVKHFFINLATSGKYSKKSKIALSDYLIRYALLNFTCFFGIIVLLAYNVLNLGHGLYEIVMASSAMIFICGSCIVLARTRLPQIVPSSLLLLTFSVFCVWLTHINQVLGLNFLFIYVFPPLAILLLGLLYGIILSATLLLSIVTVMFVPGLSHFEYHIETVYRVIASYTLVFFVMIVIEHTRRTKDKLIESQRLELQKFNRNLKEIVKEKLKMFWTCKTPC